MADQADVRSLERLESFSSELGRFRTQLLKEIESLEVELRRLTFWLENDALTYWTDELANAQRAFTDAQRTLSQCMSYVRVDEKRPCTEEKKRLLVATRRREECQSKLKTVKAAIMHWERARTSNRARIERCRELGDAELLNALQHLRGQVERLEQYANLRSGSSGRTMHATSQAQSGFSQAPRSEPTEPLRREEQ